MTKKRGKRVSDKDKAARKVRIQKNKDQLFDLWMQLNDAHKVEQKQWAVFAAKIDEFIKSIGEEFTARVNGRRNLLVAIDEKKTNLEAYLHGKPFPFPKQKKRIGDFIQEANEALAAHEEWLAEMESSRQQEMLDEAVAEAEVLGAATLDEDDEDGDEAMRDLLDELDEVDEDSEVDEDEVVVEDPEEDLDEPEDD